jgi:transcriptional regulator of nitric oxide reductase
MQTSSRFGLHPFAALVLAICLALLGISGSARAADDPAWLKKETVERLFPQATYTRPRTGEPPAVPVYSTTGLAGYLFSTAELTDVVGFSGAPFNFVVGLDLQGKIVGVVLVEHAEPIIKYNSLGPQLKRFIEQYAGLDPGNSISLSGKGTPGGIDGISSATVSARAFNHAIVQSARLVARSRGLGSGAWTSAMLDTVSFKPMTWAELVASGAIARIEIPRNGRTAAGAEGPALELYATMATPSTIGRNLLGAMRYGEYVAPHSTQDLVVLLMGKGPYPIVDDKVFDMGPMERVRVEQGSRTFALRRAPKLYVYLPFVSAKGAPTFDQIGMFSIPADSGIDVLAPWKLVVTAGKDASAVAQPGEYKLDYKLPSPFILPPAKPSSQELDAPWKESWRAQTKNLAVLGASLVVLTVLLVGMHRLTRNARVYEWLRIGFLVFTVVWIGWIAGAQLSIINVAAWISGIVKGKGVAVLLGDPLLFVLLVFTLVSFVRRPAGVAGQTGARGAFAPMDAVVPGSSPVVAPEVRLPRGARTGYVTRTADDGGRCRGRAVQDGDLAEDGTGVAVRGVWRRGARGRPVRRTGVLPVPVSAGRSDGDRRETAAVHHVEAASGVRQPLSAVHEALPDPGDRAERQDQHGRMLLLPGLPGDPQRCERVSAAGERGAAQACGGGADSSARCQVSCQLSSPRRQLQQHRTQRPRRDAEGAEKTTSLVHSR